MTPQDLINLPGYGNAEKELRKMGKWRLTPYEKMVDLLNDALCSIDNAMDSVNDAFSQLEDYTCN